MGSGLACCMSKAISQARPELRSSELKKLPKPVACQAINAYVCVITTMELRIGDPIRIGFTSPHGGEGNVPGKAKAPA